MSCGAEGHPSWVKGHTVPAAWDHKPVSAQRDKATAESIGGLPEKSPYQDSGSKEFALTQGTELANCVPRVLPALRGSEGPQGMSDGN